MMTDHFVLTIYIPTYNRHDSLKNCLTAISREMVGFEDKVLVYVSNNASTDNTREYLQSLDYKWLHIRHNKENVGAPLNILHCFELPIESEFIWPIGDDDYLLPNSISGLVSLIEQYPATDYIFCNTKAYTEEEPAEVLKRYFETGSVEGGIVKSRTYTGTALVDFERLIDPHIADTLLCELMVHCFRQSKVRFDVGEVRHLYQDPDNWESMDFETAGKVHTPQTLPFLHCLNGKTKAVYCDIPRTFNFWGAARWMVDYDFIFPVIILFLISQYRERGFISEDKFLSLLDYYYAIMGPSLTRQVNGQSTARPFNRAIRERMFEFLYHYMSKRRSTTFNSTMKAGMFEYLFSKITAHSEDADTETKSLSPAPGLTSIIILTFNQLDHTKPCLRSIEEHTPELHELIIVDNGSTDGTLDYLRKYADERNNVRVISNKENLGFAAGNNQGMAIAKGEYLLLLNNDTIVTEGWLARMLSVLEKYPDVGIVGPVSNNVSGPQQVKEATYGSLAKMHWFAREWSTAHSGETMTLFRVVGFCLLTRRTVVEKIGGLDEQFGSGNFEDDDFCLRAAAAGYQARIANDAFIHHAGSQTFKGAGIDYQQSLERNWGIFKTKWRLPEELPDGAYTVDLNTNDVSRCYVPLPAVTEIMPLVINALPSQESQASGGCKDGWSVKKYHDRLNGISGPEQINGEGTPVLIPSEFEPGLISIIMVTHNGLDQTKRCVTSIRNHTIQSHEIVFVDDGSTDGTVKWLRRQAEINRNYRLIEENKNVGRSKGRNIGMGMSKGEFIVVMDDNALVETGWLDSMLHCLKSMPDAGVVGPISHSRNNSCVMADPYPSAVHLSEYAAKLREQYSYRRTRYRNIDGFCLLFKRALVKEIGLFDDRFEAGHFEDDDFCLRSAVAGYTNYMAGSVFVSRNTGRNPAEISSSLSRATKMFDEKWTAIDLRTSLGKKVFCLGTIDKAATLNQKGELDQAIATLIDGIKYAPEEKLLYYHLAEMLLDAKLYKDAFEAVDSMPPAAINDLRRLEIIACCKQGLGEPGEYVDQILEAHRNSPLALNLKGMNAYKQGDLLVAEGLFREAIATDPGYGLPYTNLGILKWASNQEEEALDCLEKGFVLSPNSMESTTLYHSAVTEMEQFARAEGLIQEATIIHPESKRVLFFLIDTLIKQHKYQGAMDEIEKALLNIGIDDGILGAALEIRNRVGAKEINKATTNRGTLSLCMIVKNEEQHLARCLLSVKPVVDEVIIVDTGSTDRTKDIAKVYGARVFDFPWTNDFSAARNHSLSMATGDWILVLDADEVISPLDYARLQRIVKKRPAKPAAYTMFTRNYTNEVAATGWTANDRVYRREEAGTGWFPSLKVRLFPNNEQIRFRNPVHELVEPSLANAGVEMKHLNIPVHHYGRFDTEKLLKKGKAYFLLGKQKLQEMKGDFRALKELAVQACELGEFEAGIDLWKVVIERDQNDAMAFLNLSYAYLKLEQYKEAFAASRRATELDPTMKEAALNYAGCEFIVGDVNEAISILDRLLQKERDYPPAIALIAAAYYVSGRKEEGLKLLEKLRKMGFNCIDFFNEQYRGVISQGRVDQAVLLLEAAVESGNVNQDTTRLIEEYEKNHGGVKDRPEILRTVAAS
jgi:GT2 family glycosyltransferase/tetratricopeptide (TPR) repeat protein